MDALIVQSADAGGHWGTFTPERPPERLRLPELVRAVRAATDLPVMAVGGIGTSADVAAALEAGAQAVAVGTLLLLADEAGTNPAHRAGFAEDRGDPVTTSAFSAGRRAGCPTPSSRRTTAAARWATRPCTTSPARSARPRPQRANPEHVNLWAGTGHRNVVRATGRGDPARAACRSDGSGGHHQDHVAVVGPTVVLLLQVGVGELDELVLVLADDGLAARALDAGLHVDTIASPRRGAVA